MEYGAIDLHTRRSQIRIAREDGSVCWSDGSTRLGTTWTACLENDHRCGF
jgi:hypothetical protein